MSLLSDFYVANTGEIVTNPYAITQRIIPPARRPDAGEQPEVERTAFAVLTDSGELPIAFIQQVRPRPEETARIIVSETAQHPDEPEDEQAAEPRPWFYRGAHRLTRSRALLFAATWPGGVR